MATLEEIFEIVNGAIDVAFMQEKYNLNFLEYLQAENFKKEQITSFINSNLGVAIVHQIEEIDVYIEGGEKAAFFREAYSWMGKPRARRVRDYLNQIMEDAKKYEKSKRRGRKPKATANK